MNEMAMPDGSQTIKDPVIAQLRLEGLALAAGALAAYALLGGSWWLVAVLILAPDLGFLGYLGGPRLGAYVYNALHFTALPISLGLAGLAYGSHLGQAVALIWLAHIGIDRACGYGLKHQSGFAFTHLGRIGPAKG